MCQIGIKIQYLSWEAQENVFQVDSVPIKNGIELQVGSSPMPPHY